MRLDFFIKRALYHVSTNQGQKEIIFLEITEESARIHKNPDQHLS